MPVSTTESVLQALVALLADQTSASVLRNAVVPQTLPANGLVIVRDGEVGPPEQVLGGFTETYYAHTVDLEIIVEGGADPAREARFDALATEIGTALAGEPTLGGRVFGMTYGRPEVLTEAIEGAEALKIGILRLTLEYAAPSPLG